MSSGNITIREMHTSDFAEWVRMRSLLWPSTGDEAHRGEIETAFRYQKLQAFIALRDSTPVGFCEVSVRPYVNGCETSPVPFVEGLWVEDSSRRMGVAQQLIDATVAWAKAQGFTELGSDVEISNDASLQAHLNWGFEETERAVYFRKKLK